jgi:hypothetical protein
MRIELLWWRGCPSWERAIELVGEQMTAAGLDPGSLEVREVRDEADAERESFTGSPTILIDGRDIEAAPEAAGGSRLTCRVYRLRDGRISALPDPADIAAALAGRRTE